MPTEPEWSRELPFPARLLLVAVFLFVIVSVWAVLANLVLEASGFFAWLYGFQPVVRAQTPGQAGPEVESLRARMGLWASAAAFPFWVASVVAFFRWVRLVAPADIGLTLRGAGRNALYGASAAVVLAPLVLGLNYGAVWLFKDVLQWPVQEHPLAFAGRHGLSGLEWVLLALAVMVAAPLSEELVFRGALQRLFLDRPWSPHVAVFATALLFAAVHSFAWPTPVALFVLGLGLGYLALRTHSLVAPIVLHSLFNGVSYVLLLAGWSG
jgi:membrane protease YdiL (CAAX protease family)